MTCADCGLVATGIAATDTRVGAEQGWRLMRRPTTDGRFVAELRCPRCWTAYRAKKNSQPPGAA